MYAKIFLESMMKEIKMVYDAKALIATVILIYVCIDSLAYLTIPSDKKKQTKKDFIDWVNKYLKTDQDQPYLYTGDDIYAARCSMLHAWSSKSDHGSKNSCKMFSYQDSSEHRMDQEVDKQLVLLSVPRLMHDLFTAIKSFLDAASNDKGLKFRIDQKLPGMFAKYNFDNDNNVLPE